MAASSGGLCPEGEEHRAGVGQGSPVSLGLRLHGQWPGPGEGFNTPVACGGISQKCWRLRPLSRVLLLHQLALPVL